ncbi:glycosyltransferase [Variovorax sp. S2]|uniref:glycosyltransferase family 2 protein n=1 Tax=Variovorax sp. S12S4 TaxID=3029170 RepID=UPI00215C0D56|nr:glycosyltransferase family 2 protein [Variovorax sp. S12S4]MCR8956736.1 glycosyltransferase [Variovorax sp. S12S4]
MSARTSPRLVPFEVIFEKTNRTWPAKDGITVAVSLFNYAQFVVECLDSIARQTHSPLDLIVVDDHSKKDDSVAVARHWMEQNSHRFDRISLLRHTRNQGLAEARNTAFEHARTDPVFVIDADNQIYPRALARLFGAIEHREFDAAYTQIELFGDQSGLGYADVWSKSFFRSGNYVDAMALISKRSWRQVGGYTHIEGGWEDFDFWCKFVDQGMRALYVPEILCRYRVHGTSMLRTDTVGATARLKIELTMRHPWLHLR